MNAGRKPVARLKKLLHNELTRFRYAYAGHRLFDGVERFCLFLGYPRSGHTLLGSFINAHPDAVLSLGGPLPELLDKGYGRDRLYAAIMERARGRGEKKKDRYSVNSKWEGGRYERLRLIGHKRAGEASRVFAARLELLETLRETVGVPLRAVHVVRNPYDNIATISRKHEMTLPDAIDYYFYMSAAIRVLKARFKEEEFITVRHENVIANPQDETRRLFELLSLTVYDQLVDDCAAIVYPRPHRSRSLVEWSAEHRNLVAERIREYSDLASYTYED